MTISHSKLAAFIGVVGVAAGATLTVFPAAATRAPDAANTAVVRYGDIDLTSDRGAEKLYERLSHAAREVCGETRDPLYMRLWQLDRQCEQAAVARAVGTLGAPKLTAAFDRHVGGGDSRRAALTRAHTGSVGS